jgi:hypothetical protein
VNRCACGAEFFMVHSCAVSGSFTPAASTLFNPLAVALQEAEELIKEQQSTITSLMLELVDVRMALERCKGER